MNTFINILLVLQAFIFVGIFYFIMYKSSERKIELINILIEDITSKYPDAIIPFVRNDKCYIHQMSILFLARDAFLRYKYSMMMEYPETSCHMLDHGIRI